MLILFSNVTDGCMPFGADHFRSENQLTTPLPSNLVQPLVVHRVLSGVCWTYGAEVPRSGVLPQETLHLQCEPPLGPELQVIQ